LAKYKVVSPFKNKETKKEHEVNEEIELTVKRADEINKAMKERNVELTVERIDKEEGK
jgi:hypothetical protein